MNQSCIKNRFKYSSLDSQIILKKPNSRFYPHENLLEPNKFLKINKFSKNTNIIINCFSLEGMEVP